MGDVLNILLLQNTLRTATPVVLAALGCMYIFRICLNKVSSRLYLISHQGGKGEINLSCSGFIHSYTT